MSDRVAEALAALEAAEKEATPGEWEPGVSYNYTKNAEFIAKARNSFPALLKLARAWLVERGGPSNEALDALNELADAVLGPAPTPEEHRAS